MAAATIAAAFTMIVSVGSASATTLKGEWQRFNRCPVDDPSMLASSTNVGTLAICLTVESSKGLLTIGGTTLPTGPINSQMGVIGNEAAALFNAVASEGSGIAAPAQPIPGGLAALVCAKGSAFKGDLCSEASSRPARLNNVTSKLETAGSPSNFNLFAGLQIGIPIVTLPVKVHLQNPILGPNCFIGSNAHPILLQPASTRQPEPAAFRFDAEGTPDPEGVIFDAFFTHAAQADVTFAVGTATGCGSGGRLDDAINHRFGLPSPAGANSMVWKDVASYLIGLNVGTSTDGTDFAALWHGAVIG